MSIYVWKDSWPLCFTAEQANSTVQLTQNWTPTSVSLETSTDWNTWSSYTIGDTITLSNVWDKVYWRNTSTTDTGLNIDSSNRYQFVMSWSIAWSWDTTTLLNKNWTDTLSLSCFSLLFFSCKSLISSPELPATTLADSCYSQMFYWCTNLVTPPELPATTLAYWCYEQMFYSCTALTTPPKLSSTTPAVYCYSAMFRWCTNLETLPKLPATTLADNCYSTMFMGCSKIKLSSSKTWDYQTAYRIPTTWTGTTWTNSLYRMFYQTWWTFTWTPSINTTYYTSNTVV